MSIDVVIRQKGFHKKTLPLSVILGDSLSCGVYEAGGRLDVGNWEGGEIAVFDPSHIGRGFTVTWTPTQTKGIALRALQPTCPEELMAFYGVIDRITAYWRCSMTVDGAPMTTEQFRDGMLDMLEVNRRFLDLFVEKSLEAEEYEGMTLFSAMWPLEYGAKEAAATRDAPEGAMAHFSAWLHEKQIVDSYYAVAGYTEREGGLYGRFALTEGCDSLIPLRPCVPFGVVDRATGKAPEVEGYEVALVSTTERGVMGTIPYESFLEALKALYPHKVTYFDAKRVRVAPLDYRELEAILERASR